MDRKIKSLSDNIKELVEHRLFVPTCIVTGIFLRLLWIWMVDAEQVLDFLWYYQRAVSIATGGGYAVDGVPTGYWPIGYPGFLGGLFYLFGASVLLGKLVNVVLYVGVILLTYRLSKRMFHSENAARIALCVLCFYPNHIAYSAILSSEVLFIFLVALSAVLFEAGQERMGLLMLSGLFWGIATLTKPQASVLPLVFLLLSSKSFKHFLKAGLAVYCALLLTVMPWMVRNYSIFGTPTLAHTGGINLLDGNNPYATGRHNFDENVNALLGDLKTTPLEYMFDGKEVERDVRARNVAIDYIIHNSGRTLSLWPRKFVALYLSDVDGFYYSMGMMQGLEGNMRLVYLALRGGAEIYYGGMIVLFAVSLPMVLKARVRPYQIGLAIIVCLTLVYLVLFGNARYHFPMMPWLAIYSGVGAQLLLFGQNTFPLASEQT